MKIEGILLDMDNTVYDYRSAHEPSLDASLTWFSQKFGHSLNDLNIAYSQCRQGINTELHGQSASHSRLLYFQRMCEHFKISPCQIAAQAEDLYWSTFFQNMKPRPGCVEFLKSLKPLPVAIVTDLTARIQFEKIQKLGFANLIDVVVTSEEAGHEKPHPRIFEIAMKKLALEPSNLCMIGDSWERDIEGALRFPIKCYWLRTKTKSPLEEQSISTTLQSLPSGNVTPFSDFAELSNLVHSLV